MARRRSPARRACRGHLGDMVLVVQADAHDLRGRYGREQMRVLEGGSPRLPCANGSSLMRVTVDSSARVPAVAFVHEPHDPHSSLPNPPHETILTATFHEIRPSPAKTLLLTVPESPGHRMICMRLFSLSATATRSRARRRRWETRSLRAGRRARRSLPERLLDREPQDAEKERVGGASTVLGRRKGLWADRRCAGCCPRARQSRPESPSYSRETTDRCSCRRSRASRTGRPRPRWGRRTVSRRPGRCGP